MKLISLLVLLIPTLSFGQNYLEVFDRYDPFYSFEWNGFEAKDEYEVEQKFVEFAETNGLLENILKALEITKKQLRYQINAVDINNDKIADIIYQGPHMGEGSVVHIFLQTKSGFENIFTTYQGIVTVDWNGELLDKLYVRDWGCCADPNLTNMVYQVSYSNSTPTFKLIWESVELRSFVTKPKSTFSPKRFEITLEQYKLRANPWIDDVTTNEFLGITGNTIGILEQGFKGTAYAQSVDETGRIWWYVLVDKEHELKDTYINYEAHESKPHLIGWISSRFIDELDD